MEFHDVAGIFPLMAADEFAELVADIRQHGLMEPIWTHKGKIIDGRNRYRACIDACVPPTFREWDGQGSLITFVVSLNLKRRHLTASQKAVVAVDMLPHLEAEARKRQLASLQQFSPPVSQKIDEREHVGRSTERAAQVTGTNRQYVSDAKRIQQYAPAVLDAVRDGTMDIPTAKVVATLPERERQMVTSMAYDNGLTPTYVKRTIKELAREGKREQNRTIIDQAPPTPLVAFPGQKFRTIVIDPPWDWGDEGDADQFGRARPDYATMTFDQIAALPVGDLVEENAHIYLWITNRSLPKGFALLDAWGFRYITAVTWCKPSIGMGNYFRGSTEHVLFGVRGSLPLLRRDMGTWFAAPRGQRHSEKPQAFFEMVEQCSEGPWMEMFSRSERRGWSTWGETCSKAS